MTTAKTGLRLSQVGIGSAMLSLIARMASVTPAQSDNVPTAMLQTTALLRWEDAVGAGTP